MSRNKAMAGIDALLSMPPPSDEGGGGLKADPEIEIEQAENEDPGVSLLQAKHLYQMATDLLKGLQQGITGLPQPGSIMLPLSILILFFFLLIPINGKTRAMWLWSVLTGHANIQGGGNSNVIVVSPSTPQENNETTNLNTQQITNQTVSDNVRIHTSEDWM